MATHAPRTRDGQKYPGGRQLRRAFRKLAERQAGGVPTVTAKGNPIPAGAYTAPGRMRP